MTNERARSSARENVHESRIPFFSFVIDSVRLARCSSRPRARLPRQGDHHGLSVRGRHRCRHHRALFQRQARRGPGQDGDRAEQAGRHRQYRERDGRAGQARRLHDLDHAGELDHGGRALSVQEAAVRPGQGFHARDHLGEPAVRPHRRRQEAAPFRRRPDHAPEGAQRRLLRRLQQYRHRRRRAVQGRHQARDRSASATGTLRIP